MPHAAPKTYTIVLLPGDGVGPEVTRAARDVLSVIGDFYGHTFSFTEHLIGGAAIDAVEAAIRGLPPAVGTAQTQSSRGSPRLCAASTITEPWASNPTATASTSWCSAP